MLFVFLKIFGRVLVLKYQLSVRSTVEAKKITFVPISSSYTRLFYLLLKLRVGFLCTWQNYTWPTSMSGYGSVMSFIQCEALCDCVIAVTVVHYPVVGVSTGSWCRAL